MNKLALILTVPLLFSVATVATADVKYRETQRWSQDHQRDDGKSYQYRNKGSKDFRDERQGQSRNYHWNSNRSWNQYHRGNSWRSYNYYGNSRYYYRHHNHHYNQQWYEPSSLELRFHIDL